MAGKILLMKYDPANQTNNKKYDQTNNKKYVASCMETEPVRCFIHSIFPIANVYQLFGHSCRWKRISLSTSLLLLFLFHHTQDCFLPRLTTYVWAEVIASEAMPDRPFRNFRTHRWGDRLILWSWRTDFEAQKIVEYLVGWYKRNRIISSSFHSRWSLAILQAVSSDYYRLFLARNIIKIISPSINLTIQIQIPILLSRDSNLLMAFYIHPETQ